MNLYNYHDEADKLIGHADKDELVPREVWNKYKKQPEELKKREKILARNAATAFFYASHILNDRFKLGEPALAKNSKYALYYAELIGEFPLAEPLFADNAVSALEYSTEITHKPFPAGEPLIADTMAIGTRYLQFFPERKDVLNKIRKDNGKTTHFH